MAIRDCYDALIETITNADDSYVRLGTAGQIEIEVERRKGAPDILRIRDYAEGMTAEQMDKRIGRVGDRISGLAQGINVRGTNSVVQKISPSSVRRIRVDCRGQCLSPVQISSRGDSRASPQKKPTQRSERPSVFERVWHDRHHRS